MAKRLPVVGRFASGEAVFAVDSGDIADMTATLRNYLWNITVLASDASEEIARTLEDYATAVHPWQVQTGMTNLTTHGTWMVNYPVWTVCLSAGMDYDPELEAAAPPEYSTTYEWLWPTMMRNAPNIMHTYAQFLGGRRTSHGQFGVRP